MSRFKQALLDELVAYAQRPAPTAPVVPLRRRRVVWTAGLAFAGMAIAAVAALTVPAEPEPALDEAAYSVELRPNGTVLVTFRELADPDAVTHDLRAAGVRAQVVRLAEPGSCATTPGGVPIRYDRGPSAYSYTMPHDFPDHGTVEIVRNFTSTGMTIDPARIPEGGVLFIVEDITPERGVNLDTSLTREPAPTCFEPQRYEATASPLPGPSKSR
jgi:hypothetical protein